MQGPQEKSTGVIRSLNIHWTWLKWSKFVSWLLLGLSACVFVCDVSWSLMNVEWAKKLRVWWRLFRHVQVMWFLLEITASWNLSSLTTLLQTSVSVDRYLNAMRTKPSCWQPSIAWCVNWYENFSLCHLFSFRFMPSCINLHIGGARSKN